MAHYYNATFSPVPLSLAEIAKRIEPILIESGVFFDGMAFRLKSVGGAPGVESGDAVHFDSLDEAARTAAGWWGTSLACASHELGEIYVAVFPSQTGGSHVQYNESRQTYRERRADAALADALAALLLRLAAALGAEICVYEAEDDGALARVMPDALAATLQAADEFPLQAPR